jgi:hypothetical protein
MLWADMMMMIVLVLVIFGNETATSVGFSQTKNDCSNENTDQNVFVEKYDNRHGKNLSFHHNIIIIIIISLSPKKVRNQCGRYSHSCLVEPS